MSTASRLFLFMVISSLASISEAADHDDLADEVFQIPAHELFNRVVKSTEIGTESWIHLVPGITVPITAPSQNRGLIISEWLLVSPGEISFGPDDRGLMRLQCYFPAPYYHYFDPNGPC